MPMGLETRPYNGRSRAALLRELCEMTKRAAAGVFDGRRALCYAWRQS